MCVFLSSCFQDFFFSIFSFQKLVMMCLGVDIFWVFLAYFCGLCSSNDSLVFRTLAALFWSALYATPKPP